MLAVYAHAGARTAAPSAVPAQDTAAAASGLDRGHHAGGPGAPPGDLYLHVGVRAHDIFQRAGANIFCRVPLPMTQAALGGDVEVPAIDGSKARVKIHAPWPRSPFFRSSHAW